MTAVSIERAKRGQAAEILALQKLAYQSEARIYDDFGIPPLVQTLAELVAQFADHTILVATLDHAVRGSVRAKRTGGTVFVGRLIVHPDAQRRGLGRRLMAAIETDFPDAEGFELFTGPRSEGNLRLYTSLGYVAEPAPRADGMVYLRKPRAKSR